MESGSARSKGAISRRPAIRAGPANLTGGSAVNPRLDGVLAATDSSHAVTLYH
jgi:hypothetical protein